MGACAQSRGRGACGFLTLMNFTVTDWYPPNAGARWGV